MRQRAGDGQPRDRAGHELPRVKDEELALPGLQGPWARGAHAHAANESRGMTGGQAGAAAKAQSSSGGWMLLLLLLLLLLGNYHAWRPGWSAYLRSAAWRGAPQLPARPPAMQHRRPCTARPPACTAAHMATQAVLVLHYPRT